MDFCLAHTLKAWYYVLYDVLRDILKINSDGLYYPIHIDIISMELFILYFKGFTVKISI